MPHYYFNVTSNGVFQPDIEGAELPDCVAARREATRMAGQMIKDSATRQPISLMALAVRDDAHQLVGEFMFSFAQHAS